METRDRRSPERTRSLPKVATILYRSVDSRIKVVLDLGRRSKLLEKPRRSLSPLLNSPSLLRLESAVGHHSSSKLRPVQLPPVSGAPSRSQIADAKAEMSRFDEDKYRLIRKKSRPRYRTSHFKPAVFRLWKAEIAARDLSLQRL
jgi:hypothetical protein